MDLSEIPRGAFLRHPWELARGRFFVGELVRAGLLRDGAKVLDVGAGDAWLAGELVQLESSLAVTCWDLGYEERRPPDMAGISYTAAAPSGPFDLALMLDVAEHVEDDAAFVEDVRSRLAPGGHLLFSVPAWPALFSRHDHALRHFRRYRPREGRALLEGHGFRILRSGGLFHSLLLPRVLQKWMEPPLDDQTKLLPPPDLAWGGGAALHQLVLGALAVDRGVTRLSAALKLPVPGLSWWALCRARG